MQKHNRFSLDRWRIRCEALAIAASHGAGFSHTLFVQRFSAAVDGEIFALSSAEQAAAVSVAREWDYLPGEKAGAVPVSAQQ